MTWILMAAGSTPRVMARYGNLCKGLDGLLIRQAVGSGSLITAGHGFRTSPGAGRRITMDAGSIPAVPGAGGQDRSTLTIARCGRLPLCSLSALVTIRDLASVPLAGSRLARLILTTHGMAVALTG